MSMEPLPDALRRLFAQGHLRDVDVFLADTLRRTFPDAGEEVLLGVALASRTVAEGHVCLPLVRYAGAPWPDGDNADPVILPPLPVWIHALRASDACSVSETGRPLVLVDGPEPRLYLGRYYLYEQRVAAKLLALAAPAAPSLVGDPRDQLIRCLFPDPIDEAPRRAAAAALDRRLVMITGGPGTGKTHTMARLLVLLAEDVRGRGGDPVIRMAAPTGKAAKRMAESLREARSGSLRDLSACQLAGLPEDACTLHRLLGSRRGSPHFRHDAKHPLPADALVVDEASMIDLPMMAKLLDALSPETRLILLGDMHQLSSVEPGFVFGDICAAARASANDPLSDSLVSLTHSRRFSADGSIGMMSRALLAAGEKADPAGDEAWKMLESPATEVGEGSPYQTEVRWRETPRGLYDAKRQPLVELRRLVIEGYAPFLQATTPAEAFEAMEMFRILCPRRHGRFGVLALNQLAEEALSLGWPDAAADSPVPPPPRLRPTTPFYDHRPILITRNDYGQDLYNGDIGIILPGDADGRPGDGLRGSSLAAWFETTDANTGIRGYRSLPCGMLPDHETAFAMSVHKSQGSQFRDLLLMVPPDDSPLLTREMFYTAITRARQTVHWWCREEVFRAAALRRVERSGGLRDTLLHRGGGD